MPAGEWDYQEVELLGVAKYKSECDPIVAEFKKTSGSQQVLSVKRIQNTDLWMLYSHRRKLIESKPDNTGKPNEVHLWHGARDAGTTMKIAKSGFEVS